MTKNVFKIELENRLQFSETKIASRKSWDTFKMKQRWASGILKKFAENYPQKNRIMNKN